MKNFIILTMIVLGSWTGLFAQEWTDQRSQSQGSNPVPIVQRGIDYQKFLATSVKIFVKSGQQWGSAGSGTIVHYDAKKKLAYVATCGHLWTKGIMSSEQGKIQKKTCQVTIWYHNDKKLDVPKNYDANVVFYSYIDGQDTALITFTPDWIPNYFPIAPIGYVYNKGIKVHSLGSDGAEEAGHYEVEIVGLSSGYHSENDPQNNVVINLVTDKNSPRSGRSGGGLIDDNGYYIGTCWGSEYLDGTGKGLFTPLSVIHSFWQKQGYDVLLHSEPTNVGWLIPVVDRTGPQGKYNPFYIISPKK